MTLKNAFTKYKIETIIKSCSAYNAVECTVLFFSNILYKQEKTGTYKFVTF